MPLATTDLLDTYPELDCCTSSFLDLGGHRAFSGPVRTVRCRDDNTALRNLVETPGEGGVIVVDALGTTSVALIGDRLARRAADNGWVGLVIDGAVRDRLALAEVPLGIRALAVVPRRSPKHGTSEVDVLASVAGVAVAPGGYLWSDADGIVIASAEAAARILQA